MAEQWIIGNWKMNGSRAMAESLLMGVLVGAKDATASIGICPPFPYLAQVSDKLVGSKLALGAQNVHAAKEGAYTGEVSAAMLANFGVTLCIVGHSERRQLFGEQDATVRDKIQALLAEGLRPILCVGETLEQREAGHDMAVVKGQLNAALEGLQATDCARLLVAYEPVWAIGTGRTATPEQAQAMHATLRSELVKRFDKTAAGRVPLLYGGSVTPDNAGKLLAQVDIDGALVGGASLKTDPFLGIIKHAR